MATDGATNTATASKRPRSASPYKSKTAAHAQRVVERGRARTAADDMMYVCIRYHFGCEALLM